MRYSTSRAIGILVVALSLSLSSFNPARAQDQISEAQLESFVTAAISVNDLVEEWQSRITGAETPEEQAELREQANEELVETIEQTEGMTIEEYQQIGQAAQADPALAQRINEIYQARVEQQ